MNGRRLSSIFKYYQKSKFRVFVNAQRDGNEEYQLSCFCDSSAKAYATAVYLRVISNQLIEVNLVFAKASVASKKDLILPRP